MMKCFFPGCTGLLAALITAISLLPAGPVAAQDMEGRPLAPDATGAVYESKSADGHAYRYFIPASYDPERGANLTMILHGSNLTRGWGFSNHRAGDFRPDDIVVSPDGTTPNSQGGFNFLRSTKDLARLRSLHDEIRATLNVRSTWLYGHSQGSFFALYYAGAHPDLVQGVVAHASGVWTGTEATRRHHHQAIVLMHGTADPVVPYGQSAAGIDVYQKAGYPHARLRSLEGWNHWPAEHNGPVRHTSQQLAWCEGMTTDDPERLAASFRLLVEVSSPLEHDYAALHAVATRAAAFEGVSSAVRARAKRAAAAIERLAEAHVAAIGPPGRRGAPGTSGGEAWAVHAPRFFRSFSGVPACDALLRRWASVLDRHKKEAGERLGRHYEALRAGDIPAAFAAGVDAVRAGYLHVDCTRRDFLKRLADWHAAAGEHRLPAAAVRAYESAVEPLEKSIEAGLRAYRTTNERAGDL